MKTEKQIRDFIAKTTADNLHVLDCYPATVQINAPRAMMQSAATTILNVLYDILEEERPKFKCDDFEKMNY